MNKDEKKVLEEVIAIFEEQMKLELKKIELRSDNQLIKGPRLKKQ
jgi:hypothetical protein